METNILNKIEYPKEGIISKQIPGAGFNITLFSMSKNSEISEHTSTKKALVYVLEGSGIFNLQNKEIQMNPGTLIQMPENAKHSLSAKENTSFLLILA